MVLKMSTESIKVGIGENWGVGLRKFVGDHVLITLVSSLWCRPGTHRHLPYGGECVIFQENLNYQEF